MNNEVLLYLLPICVLIGLGLVAIVAVSILRPSQDNSQIITTIIGLLTPTLVALIAAVKSIQNGQDIKELHIVVNSRLSQLLQQTAMAAKLAERGLIASEFLPDNIKTDGSIISSLVQPPAKQIAVDEVTSKLLSQNLP